MRRRQLLFSQLHCCRSQENSLFAAVEEEAELSSGGGRLPLELRAACPSQCPPAAPCRVGQELMGHTSFPKLGHLGLLCPVPRASLQAFLLWLASCLQPRPGHHVQRVNPANPGWQRPTRVLVQSKSSYYHSLGRVTLG